MMLMFEKRIFDVDTTLTLQAKGNSCEIEGTHPTNHSRQEILVSAFAARIIVPIAVMISLPATVVVFPTARAISIALSASTIPVVISSGFSRSYRLPIATCDTSRAAIASIAVSTAATSTVTGSIVI